MIKGVICVTCSVIFLIINTIILFMKSEFTYALNDKNNYCVYYQKWIKSVVFMSTIIIALICIYFSINIKIQIALFLLFIECLLVVIYSLCKYKGITVNEEKIIVERLFRKTLTTKFSSIASVNYLPNARLVVKLKNKQTFDISFNSVNFHNFYKDLLSNDIRFKTGFIHNDENHVYLTKYNITVHFPKTMFREYYQNERFLRNSRYLFSARSLENHEYIEGYIKESGKELNEFVELIQTDLKVNNFVSKDIVKEDIDGYPFTIIKSTDKKNKELSRLAYIYKDIDNYLIIYSDIKAEKEEEFMKKMRNSIRRSVYEDGKNRIVRV